MVVVSKEKERQWKIGGEGKFVYRGINQITSNMGKKREIGKYNRLFLKKVHDQIEIFKGKHCQLRFEMVLIFHVEVCF